MTITVLGELSVAGAIPGCAVAVAAGMGGINSMLPDLLAQLANLQALLPVLPPSFEAQIASATAMVEAAQLALTAIPPLAIPDVAGALAAVIAGLTAQIGLINAQLGLLVNLQAPLLTAGVAAYAYAGPVNTFGGELAGALGPSPAAANGVVLVTTNPATWTAMSAVLKVT